MAKSEELRKNINQHKAKNIYSKKDDQNIIQAQYQVLNYISKKFKQYFSLKESYHIILEKQISYKTIHQFIKRKSIRKEFDTFFSNRTIKPDGGILYLKNYKSKEFAKVLLIAETKRQGTNDIRQQEGKPKQSQGNAIERLGKNLTGIKAMLNHELITPFVCFGWGYDFDLEENDFVLSKISMLNEFYPINKIHVYKKDGNSNYNSFSPVSMFFRRNQWTKNEMFEIMKEIAETSFRYYMH